MKFLEYTPFIRINGFLNNVDLGDCRVKGFIEAYSCKLAGADKKMSRSIEQEVLETLEQSPQDSTSPVGPLSSMSSRRTLIHLILTLSHQYPDYDFSMLRPRHFLKEDSLESVKENIKFHLLEATKIWASETGEDCSLVDKIWGAIDEVIDIRDCEVYNFTPDLHPLMNDRSSVWGFNYFFYNKKLKRILCFCSQCVRKTVLDENQSDGDGDDFFEMD